MHRHDVLISDTSAGVKIEIPDGDKLVKINVNLAGSGLPTAISFAIIDAPRTKVEHVKVAFKTFDNARDAAAYEGATFTYGFDPSRFDLTIGDEVVVPTGYRDRNGTVVGLNAEAYTYTKMVKGLA